MAVVDAVCRKLPGALGKEQSHLVESFSPELDGGLEYPHYTRPEEFRGWTVPEVLLSGHHGEIEALAETALTGALRLNAGTRHRWYHSSASDDEDDLP